jgi:SAM-dependent methyltransferase
MVNGDGGNAISEHWYRTFLDTVDPARTAAEVAFLERQLPLSSHSRILDLFCGRGRHAIRLAEAGYRVTGVDWNATALASARADAGSRARFMHMDVRNIGQLRQRWDAVIVMWASFGYFSHEENVALLAGAAGALRPGGRLVLDVQNRDFHESRLGVRHLNRSGMDVVEHTSMADGRLTAALEYAGHAEVDRFSWEIFRPQELVAAVTQAGFQTVILCADFDERTEPTPGHARMQLVSAVATAQSGPARGA